MTTEEPKTFGIDMVVEDEKTREFIRVWLHAGLKLLMPRVDVDCEIKVTGNVVSIEVHKLPIKAL